MALVPTIKKYEVWGSHKANVVWIAFDSSYPTGGEAYTLAQLGLSTYCLMLIATGKGAGGYRFEHDQANKKIIVKAPVSVAGGAAAAGTDALSIKANVVGKEAATAMHSAAQEVPNTADLSALTAVEFVAIGV